MLEFVAGRAGTGKTYAVLRNAVENAADFDVTYIIVPEQSTFLYEKQLIRYNAHAKRMGVEILSFTSLVDKVMSVTGGNAGNYISNTGKTALVFRALKNCADNLEIFGKYADKPVFAGELAETLDELKINAVSSDSLIAALATDAIGGTLKQKTHDIAIIAAEYDRLTKDSFFDPVDRLGALEKILEGYDYFGNKCVCFDGFTGFTVLEELIVKRIIEQSKKCVISLPAPTGEFDDGELFYPIASMKKHFAEFAGDRNIAVNGTLVLTDDHKFENEGMRSLEKCLYTDKKAVSEENSVTVFEGSDIYSEARFAAAKIRRLVTEEGCRYRDIAVISGDLETYRSAIEAEFEIYDIPFFIDSRSGVRFRPLVRLVLFALKAAAGGLYYEDMADIAKTGLAGLDSEQSALLENYINLWKISGSKWKNEFKMNPRGFREALTERDAELLAEINAYRKTVSEPLFKLAEKLEYAKTADKYAEAIYNYVLDCGAYRTIVENTKESYETGGEYDESRIWDTVMDVLDCMLSTMGSQEISVSDYTELLRLMFDTVDMGNIPPHSDEVLVGSEGRVRVEHNRYCIVIGAVEGVFPGGLTERGVFTNDDKEKLREADVNLIHEENMRRCEMMLSVYNALTIPSAGLCLTYSTLNGDSGYSSKSSVIGELDRIFENMHIVTDGELTYDFLCSTPAAALDVCAGVIGREKTPEDYALCEAVRRDPVLAGKLESFVAMKDCDMAALNANAAKTYFAKIKEFSATKLDVFSECPYKFFCKYGLSLNAEPSSDMSSLTMGTLVHYLLEKTVEAVKKDGYTGDIREYAIDKAKEYISSVMGGEENLTGSFLNSVYKAADLICELVEEINAELEISGFSPTDYEMKIEDRGEVTPWNIDGDSGSIKLIGTVDRVDVCELNGKKYLRIVDYKTNRKLKKLELYKVYEGYDMQMFVYLIAIMLNGKKKYGSDMVPAGVYYFPAVRQMHTDSEYEKLLKKGRTSEGMDGASLDEAPRDDSLGVTVFTNTQLMLLKDRIERVLSRMNSQIKSGDIRKFPTVRDNSLSCNYCDYRYICGTDTELVGKHKLSKQKNEKVLEKLAEEADADE